VFVSIGIKFRLVDIIWIPGNTGIGPGRYFKNQIPVVPVLFFCYIINSDHPEMDGHPIGVYRKLGRDQGVRKILPQAYG
jgi:hypothetical protein